MEKTPAIIPRIPAPEHRPAWQTLLARAVKSTDELLGLLEIDPAQLKTRPLDIDFPLRVPRGFVARMGKGDLHDPLLRQVLPVDAELRQLPGYENDPLGEHGAMPDPGLLHKYRGRALLIVTGACGIHCRYCFRRHFPYAMAGTAGELPDATSDWLQRHPDVSEIILSGGDPLTLSDARLHTLCSELEKASHLRTLRIHTRLPIVLPERIDDGFLSWIAARRLRLVMVVHSNHPNEINTPVAGAMQCLQQAGVTLLNQSVLLRGVNDDATTLAELSEALFSAGVLPYYLHQLDRVQGAAHFEVDDATARELVAELHASLPGYLVPRLVREQPGKPGKTPL